VPQDYKRAAEWYGKASEQGHPKAQFNLGRLYENGYGVPQDKKIAKFWYDLARQNGYGGPK
jgi:TPR repeat protein